MEKNPLSFPGTGLKLANNVMDPDISLYPVSGNI